MINIAELLKDAPTGMKLYSPLFGEVEFSKINSVNAIEVIVTCTDGTQGIERFHSNGTYISRCPNAECLLFPSKDCRTWEGWKVPSELNLKVGDWIVKKDGNTFYGGNYAEQITLVEVDEKGKYIWLPSKTWVDADYIRLWTIADARDGDVITNGKMIFIFNKLEGPAYKQQIIAYVGLDLYDKIQITKDTWQLGIDKAMPATKEQRDLLFAKMQEAGYQWDADKKELKKIPKHYDIANFKPFDKILGRNCCRSGVWRADYFSHIHKNGKLFVGIGYTWEQCIPFNEKTKHLLGTTDMPSEEYINW